MSYLYIIEYIEFADEYVTSRKHRCHEIFHNSTWTHRSIKKQILLEKTHSGIPGHMQQDIYYRKLKIWRFITVLIDTQ